MRANTFEAVPHGLCFPLCHCINRTESSSIKSKKEARHRWKALASLFQHQLYDVRAGLSAKQVCIMASGYRSPCVVAFSHACRISCSSSFDSLMCIAFRFSSRRSRLVVPGIGKISSPCARSHARVSAEGVTPLRFAIAASWSASTRFLGKFCTVSYCFGRNQY